MIRAHQDIRGLDVSWLVSNHVEAEVLLDKNVTYVIRSIKKSQGGIKYVAEVDALFHKDA